MKLKWVILWSSLFSLTSSLYVYISLVVRAALNDFELHTSNYTLKFGPQVVYILSSASYEKLILIILATISCIQKKKLAAGGFMFGCFIFTVFNTLYALINLICTSIVCQARSSTCFTSILFNISQFSLIISFPYSITEIVLLCILFWWNSHRMKNIRECSQSKNLIPFCKFARVQDLSCIFYCATIFLIFCYVGSVDWLLKGFEQHQNSKAFRFNYNNAAALIPGINIVSKVIMMILFYNGMKQQKPLTIFVSCIIGIASLVLITVTIIGLMIFFYISPTVRVPVNKYSDDFCTYSNAVFVSGFLHEAIVIRVLWVVRKVFQKVADQTNGIPLPVNRLIAGSCIQINENIGAGEFGDVYKGLIVVDGKVDFPEVAIKSLKPQASERCKRALLVEATVLSDPALRHDNIIKFISLCIEPPLRLCLEFANGGSLLGYLREPSTKDVLKFKDSLKTVHDICKGCKHLASQNYIHRDISAKNCLVFKSNLQHSKPEIIKLADFGLACNVSSGSYINPFTDKLVTHTSPEGLQGTFPVQSDIWSFGVVVWEVFSFGASPFGKCFSPDHLNRPCPLMTYKNSKIYEFICEESKTLLDLPDPCFIQFPESIEQLMRSCLQHKWEDRADFGTILTVIETLMFEKRFNKTSFKPKLGKRKKKPSASVYVTSLNKLETKEDSFVDGKYANRHSYSHPIQVNF